MLLSIWDWLKQNTMFQILTLRQQIVNCKSIQQPFHRAILFQCFSIGYMVGIFTMAVAEYFNFKQFLYSVLMSMKSALRYFILLAIIETRPTPATIYFIAGYAVISIDEVDEPYISSE